MGKNISSRVKKIVNEVDPTAKIILFGSRARGDNKASSDWDFLILTSRQVDGLYQDTLWEKLYALEVEEEQVISAIIENDAEWKKYVNSEFYKNIQADGKVVSNPQIA